MSWLISFHCFPFGNHDIAFTSDLLSFHLEFSIKNSFPTPNIRNDLIIINNILLLAQILKLLSHISKLWWFHTHHLSSLLTADLFYHQHSTSDDYLITIDSVFSQSVAVLLLCYCFTPNRCLNNQILPQKILLQLLRILCCQTQGSYFLQPSQ